jgi:Flp pilus assembly protein TadB
VNQLRLVLALAGFVLALLSVVYDRKELAWAAIALLGLSLVIRLWLRRRRRDPAEKRSGPL